MTLNLYERLLNISLMEDFKLSNDNTTSNLDNGNILPFDSLNLDLVFQNIFSDYNSNPIINSTIFSDKPLTHVYSSLSERYFKKGFVNITKEDLFFFSALEELVSVKRSLPNILENVFSEDIPLAYRINNPIIYKQCYFVEKKLSYNKN